MIPTMTAILYPVAANAEQALNQPLGRAEREREATRAAGEAVVFTTDATGPAFATREAALEAYRAQVNENWCRLSEQMAGKPVRRAPVEPTYQDGRRWPPPAAHPPKTAWRLMVSYWRIATAERPIEAPQARKARRAGQPLDPETLKAIARTPMRPVEPQQPLDIGLFEFRPPDAPHIVMPDD
jgi:hypothetical protein